MLLRETEVTSLLSLVVELVLPEADEHSRCSEVMQAVREVEELSL